MRKQFFIVSIVFLLSSLNSSFSQHSKFFFSMYEDRVTLSRSGGSNWLALGNQPVEIQPGDILRAQGRGKGELIYPDGTIVRLSSDAEVTVLRSGIKLKKGYVWLKVRRRADIFKVFTPLASCRVLGTSFDVNVDNFGRTNVRVFSGIVALRANEDKRNKQLVLQKGMRSSVVSSANVADKPIKFQASTIETKLFSEWENRRLKNRNKLANDQSLPPILPEIKTGIANIAPVSKETKPAIKKERIKIIARQRNEFLEMLRNQKLKKNSVIGGRFPLKDNMKKQSHTSEFGQYDEPEFFITDKKSLRHQYFLIKNRLLRVQSQIRQKEMEMSTLINQAAPSSTAKREIRILQSELLILQSEHKQLVLRLRSLQTRKR